MNIKYRYKDQNDIPEPVRPFFAEQNGEWTLQAEGAVEKGRLDEFRQNNISLQKQLEQEKARFETERVSRDAQLADLQISHAALAAAMKHGIRPSAIQDLAHRAKTAFKLHEGELRAYDKDGQTVRTGKDGTSPLSFDEWAESLLNEAPHLFEISTGGGAAGNASSPGGVDYAKNPWSRDHWNLTRQGEIWKSNRALAERLKQAAGK